MTRRIALCSNHEMSNLIWGHPLFSSSPLRLLRLSSTAPKPINLDFSQWLPWGQEYVVVVREVEVQVNVSMTKQYYFVTKLDAGNF